MSLLHREPHVPKIREGDKTETRRSWPHPMVQEGEVYMVVTDYQTTYEECDCFVRVLAVYEERLGDIDEESLDAEGGYERQQFIDLWTELHGKWDPDEMIWVVEYEYLGTEDPTGPSVTSDALSW